MSRRGLLVGSSAAVGLLSLAAGAGGSLLGGRAQDSRQAVADAAGPVPLAERAPAIPAGAAFPRVRHPDVPHRNQDFYRIDVALRIPTQAAADWSLRIHGMVDRELTLSYADLLARPLVERTITMTCVSNPVGGDLISTANFIGVELRDILLEAGVRPGADQLFSTSIDGWTAGTPVDVVLEPDRGALLAIGMNGEPLPPEHGFPVRMVVPGPLRVRVGDQVDHRHGGHHVRRRAGLLAAARLGAAGADQDPVPDRLPARLRARCRPAGSRWPGSPGPSTPASTGSRSGWTAARGRRRSCPPR